MARQPKNVRLCESCDAELNTDRKFCDERCRNLHQCTKTGTHKYRHHVVAPDFQETTRAEAAAQPEGTVLAVVNGIIRPVHRMVGECVCVTCGTVGAWSGGSGFRQMQAGHFCSRKDQLVLFRDDNVAVQCSRCNQPPGSPNEFRMWMVAVRGQEVIDNLEHLARQTFAYSRDELVDMRLEFNRRLKVAKELMKGR